MAGSFDNPVLAVTPPPKWLDSAQMTVAMPCDPKTVSADSKVQELKMYRISCLICWNFDAAGMDIGSVTLYWYFVFFWHP